MTAVDHAGVLDGSLVLDPSVEIEELAPRKSSIWSQGPAVRRGWLLVHDALEIAAVIPAGNGLGELLAELRRPLPIAELVSEDEIGTASVAWQLVDTLVRRGLAFRWHGARMPDEVEQGQLRRAWREAATSARRAIRLSASELSAEQLVARVRGLSPAPAPAPSVDLSCAGLADVGAVRGVLEQLAIRHAAGELATHELVIELAPEQAAIPELRAAVRRLGASARLRTGDVRALLAGPVVHALVADHIAAVVRIAGADALLTAESEREGVLRELGAAHVTRVELDVDWARVERDGGADDPATRAAALYARFEALVDELGDVELCGAPSDDEICGNVISDRAPATGPIERAVRALHVRRRAHYLLEMEGKTLWGQTPDVEDMSVPLADDLLPNRPELLGLGEGSIVADVAGGFGRVARRLAPHVGATGTIISVEKEPVTLDRARRFGAELGTRTIQYRVGLGQRLPLADGSVDAAVMEWGGEIHRDGLLGKCVVEMRRVLRPGGRIAITYRLCNISLERLNECLAPYPEIYPAILAAFAIDGLAVIEQKIWAMRPQLSEAPMAAMEERYLPRIIDDFRNRTLPRQPPSVDLTLTVVARKLA